MTATTMTLPLEGVRVLDLTRYTAGPFSTRLLGDYGADVVKVEPPDGDPARTLPPFAGDTPGTERSGLFLFLNTNKRSVVLDLEREQDRQRLLDLAARADVVVENFAPGTMERLGLGYEQLARANPRLVLTSISNFGQDGPYRDWQGTDLTLYAMGGPMIACGDLDYEPLKLAGHWPTYYAGYVGALATAVALRAAELRGRGEHLDLSVFESHVHAIDYRPMWMMVYQYTGRMSTRGAPVPGPGNGVYPCADGWFTLASGGNPSHVPKLLRMIGRNDLAATPEWNSPERSRGVAGMDDFNALFIPWMIEHTKAEVRAACQQFGVFGAPLNTMADVLENEHFTARHFFQEIDHPTTGPVRYPGYHFRLHSDDGPMPPRRRAPLLGEHTEEVLAEIAPAAADSGAAPVPLQAPAVNRLGGQLPLEGVRVLDLTLVWAGPYGTMHLADWGAEVIRVESRQHFQPITRGNIARPTRQMIQAGVIAPWYPDDEPGEHPWNRAGNFNCHVRGKKSMTVDLTRPEGQEVLEELVAKADGFYENNIPMAMDRLGISWERLRKINPRLIMVRVPAFGLDGPYRDYRTLGYHMDAVAGQPVIRSYPDLSLNYAFAGVAADAAAGVGGAFAFTLGLRQRERTGKGLLIELASTENIVPLLGDFVMDYTLNGRVWEQMGNEHWTLAPHNVYRCAGGDRWVTIAVRDEDDWRALCRVLARLELVEDPRFATMAARHAHRRELDALIAAWTVQREAAWVMQRLQREGVPAGVTMNEPEVLTDPHLAARGFFQELDHPETGRQRYLRRAWQASETPWRPMRHPCLLGEDNEYVYKEVLGFSEEKYRRFEALGHIGTDFAPGVP